jgi:hypothetical protein
VQGLRIRQRLKVQYGGVPNAEISISVSRMIVPLFCDYTSFQVTSGMDERHVVQPYHLPRQKYTNTTFQDNGQEDHIPGFLPHEESSEKDDEMKTHPDSLQINRDATPPPELVEGASSTTRRKTRVAPRRSGRGAPGKRHKTTSSSSENDDEYSTRRTTRRTSTSISAARSLRARKSKA